MLKILFTLAIAFLAGCSQTVTKPVDEISELELKNRYNADVKFEVYEITDKKFTTMTVEAKDSFIENITSHISEITVSSALNKYQYKLKNKYEFTLPEKKPLTFGEGDVKASPQNPGIMIVALTESNQITLDVFNRVSNGTNDYANSLSSISMPLSLTDDYSKIAYRISENEIIYVAARKIKK